MKLSLERFGRLPVSEAALLVALSTLINLAACQAPEAMNNFPYYMQSPQQQQQQQQPLQAAQQEAAPIMQRASIPTMPAGQPLVQVAAPPPPPPQQQPQLLPMQPKQAAAECLYGRHYFAHFDQCLERKPYPTIGLPAFKNDDLLAANKQHLADRHGCSFILTNGLFKHYQLSKFALQDQEAACLEDTKQAHLSLKFTNVTLYYLWQLRCLNQANQLLDDATLNGKSVTIERGSSDERAAGGKQSGADAICVGSSQNFGFASLQVSNVEAQVELAMDIYKNWRVTNITLAMLASGSNQAAAGGANARDRDAELEHAEQLKSSAIRDFAFESLDGDELNWRYLNLYENWTRNRLHTNFLEQFRRFLWISLQRCLSESADKLPVKLADLFGQQRYSS